MNARNVEGQRESQLCTNGLRAAPRAHQDPLCYRPNPDAEPCEACRWWDVIRVLVWEVITQSRCGRQGTAGIALATGFGWMTLAKLSANATAIQEPSRISVSRHAIGGAVLLHYTLYTLRGALTVTSDCVCVSTCDVCPRSWSDFCRDIDNSSCAPYPTRHTLNISNVVLGSR